MKAFMVSSEGLMKTNAENQTVICSILTPLITEYVDDVLFSAFPVRDYHVLNQLLPPVKLSQYYLKSRRHKHTSPNLNDN